MYKCTEHGALEIKLYCTKMHEKEYDAFLLEGNWPSDSDLIRLCDGASLDMPDEELLFVSGEVKPGDKSSHRIVIIQS